MSSDFNKSEQPLITIITVTFNAKEVLESTILSVVNLVGYNVDFIIIDGGSSDGSIDIIKKYYDKLFYWVSEPDKGIYDAFNKGWNAAKEHSYILYLGAGDKIINLPDKATIVNSDVIYGKVFIGNDRIFPSRFNLRLKLGNTLHHQALLVKKDLYPVSPFDLKFKVYADFDFNQRLMKMKVRFAYSDKFIGYALPGGISHYFNKKESLSVVRKNFGMAHSIMAFFYYLILDAKTKVWPNIKKPPLIE